MPILENQRYELFAQSLAQGKTAQQAYSDAGYKPSRKNAWRLKVNKDIAARVLEIQQASAASCEITVASLLAELEEARARATTSAAVRASAEKAKISGLLTQKIELEVSQAATEPQSIAEVLAEVMGKVGERAARALAEAWGLEYDEAAIMALVNGADVNSNGVNNRAIEWRPPRNRKRPIS